MSKRISISLIVTIIALILINEFFLGEPKQTSVAQVITPAGVSANSDTSSLIGGAFSLIDQDGKEFTERGLKGKYSLVYFGFTHCPDVCPLALSNMTLALKELGEAAKDFQIVFITADPERDDVKTMKAYVSNFSDAHIIGLTGTKQGIDAAKQVYRVYAEKAIASAKEGGDSSGDNYNVSHSSIIYIMDKNVQFISNLTHDTKPADMVTKLKTLN